MNDHQLDFDQLYDSIDDALQNAVVKKSPPDEQMARIRLRYPYPNFFIESSEYMLRQVGLGNAEAFYFSMIPGLTRYVERESFGEKPLLNTLSRMSAYLKVQYIGIHVECFYAVLLDSRGRLIRNVMVGRGTVDSAPFDMRRMLSLVVEHHAKALVLCHNHPSGTLRPSSEDIKCTLSAMAATATIDVMLLDHIIIADDHAVSMRDSGYIAADLWTMQGPKRKLLRDWVDVDLLR